MALLVTSGEVAGARDDARSLSLEQQVGQLVVLSFSGSSVPPYVSEALRERRAAGVILFGGNITSPAQLRRLTGDLRRGSWRPLVAVDQEGGSIRRVSWIGPARTAPEQHAAGTVRADAAAAARALLAAGITVTFAPVADVPGAQVASFELTGHLKADRTGFDATYTVAFEDGSTAEGTVTLTCSANKQRPNEVQTLCAPPA